MAFLDSSRLGQWNRQGELDTPRLASWSYGVLDTPRLAQFTYEAVLDSPRLAVFTYVNETFNNLFPVA